MISACTTHTAIGSLGISVTKGRRGGRCGVTLNDRYWKADQKKVGHHEGILVNKRQ
jgi:hypothetical protein